MKSTRLALPLAAMIFFFAAAENAFAIPAFARKYQFSCSTCHAPFPRLKPYGEEFAGRGFRMEKAEAEPPRATIDVGDPLLLLSRDFPIAARIEAFGAWNDDAEAEVDFETPWVFKVLSGAPISQRVSYYLYFIIEQGELEGLEDAYLQYNGLFGSSVDVIVGQFQVSDPLFKRELRLERADYDIYKVHVGDSQTNLTYDRGAMFLTTAPADVDLALMVVNGNGIPRGTFDRDTHKNFAARAAREFGNLRLGAFGYLGKEEDDGRTNETVYFGPDLSITGGDRWQINLQYLERRDDDPFFSGLGGPDLETRGGFAEAHYFPKGHDGRWALSLLYSLVESDDPAAEIERFSFALNYLLARNVRLLTEIGRDEHNGSNTASIGLVTAF
jgi:hypothetical protein